MPVDEYDSDGDLIPDGVFSHSGHEAEEEKKPSRETRVLQAAPDKEQARVLRARAQREAGSTFFDFEQMEQYEASAVAICAALEPDILSK